MTDAELLHGDCLEVMKSLPAGSVDAVFADLPYGTTRNKWDSVIDLDALWAEYHRLCRGPVILTAQAPFDKVLWASQPECFRHQWIWEKTLATGHLNAKRAPMKAHEIVMVFCETSLPYFPIKTTGHPRKVSTHHHRRNSKESSNYGSYKGKQPSYDSTERYPRDVIKIKSDRQKSALQPTQKPVALSTYFLETYTRPGWTVLDNTMGSGTTGISCIDTGRRFIGIEKDAEIFKIAQERILTHKPK